MTTAPVTSRQERDAKLSEVKPHRWALSLWARTYRRWARPFTVTRHVRRFCRPLTIEGREKLERLQNPGLIIAKHASHLDNPGVFSLPSHHLYKHTPLVAAR